MLAAILKGLSAIASTIAKVVEAWSREQDRQAGRAAEQRDQLARTVEAMETRREVEADTARQPDPAAELRRRWTRPRPPK